MRLTIRRGFAACAALLGAACALAQVPGKTYAQELVDRSLVQQRDLLVMVMQATPPGQSQTMIVASNIGRLGQLADPDELKLIKGGETRVKPSADGRRLSINLVLQDVVGNAVGSLGLVWPRAPGQDEAALVERSLRLRDSLAQRTLTGASLLDAYPFEAGATTKTRAQRIIDEAVAADPRIAVLALRGKASADGELVLLGSTFGRHGKKADADDLKVMSATVPATGLYGGGKRFGVDLSLHDAGGTLIGTMNVGYRVRTGEDTQPWLAHALNLRPAIEQRIASAAALAELDP